MSNKSFILWIVVLHLPYFLFQSIYQQYFLTDSYEYVYEAKNILKSFTAYAGDLNEQINNDLYTKRPVLYPIFLIFGGIQPFLISILQIILSVTSIFYLRKGMSVIGHDIKKDKFLLILIAGSISYFIYTQMIMSEILLATILNFFIYFNILLFYRFSMKRLLVVNLLLVLGFLTKPVLFPFSFIYFVFLMITFKKQLSLKLFLTSVIPLLVVASIHLINFKRTNVFHFSSIQRINLLNYNTKYFHTNNYGSEYAIEFNDSVHSITDELTYPKRYGKETSVAKNELTENLFSYILFHIKGSFRYFLDPGRFDIFNFFGKENSNTVGFLKVINEDGFSGVFNYLKKQNIFLLLILGISLLFNGIRFIGLLIFSYKTLKKQQAVWILLILLTSYFALVTGPIGASRFVVPIVIILNFMSVLAFSKIQNNESIT